MYQVTSFLERFMHAIFSNAWTILSWVGRPTLGFLLGTAKVVVAWRHFIYGLFCVERIEKSEVYSHKISY